jgi:hypothetical protein
MIRQQINVMLQTRDAVEVVGEEINVSASVLIMNRVVLVMTVSCTLSILCSR